MWQFVDLQCVDLQFVHNLCFCNFSDLRFADPISFCGFMRSFKFKDDFMEDIHGILQSKIFLRRYRKYLK
jgi:hypothetical protein